MTLREPSRCASPEALVHARTMLLCAWENATLSPADVMPSLAGALDAFAADAVARALVEERMLFRDQLRLVAERAVIVEWLELRRLDP